MGAGGAQPGYCGAGGGGWADRRGRRPGRAARALARAGGVEEALLAEWAISQPGLGERSARAAGSAAAKGWRWIAEMEEIAEAMAAAGLPDGFHQAAAEIYRRSRPQQGPRRSVR